MKLREILINDEATYCLFSPKRGLHYLKARFNTIEREIYYSKNDPAPTRPIFFFPFIEEIFHFSFTFSSLMTEQKAAEKNLTPVLTFETNLKGSGEEDDTVKAQKMCMVTRTVENQYYLYDREVHPFEIEILSEDSTSIKFVLTYTLLIEDMFVILTDYASGNFLEVAERMIKYEINCIFRGRPFDELRGSIKNGIRDELDNIKTKLNDTFTTHGFRLDAITHEGTIIPESSMERVKARQSIQIEEDKKKASVIKAEADKEVKVIGAQAEAQRLEITREAEIKMMVKETTDVGTARTVQLENQLGKVTAYNNANKEKVDETAVGVASRLGRMKAGVFTGEGIFGKKDPLAEHVAATIVGNEISNELNP